MAVIQTGSSSTGIANVDSNYNLNVNLPTTDAQAGFVCALSEADAGTVTGTRMLHAMEVSDDFRLRIAQDNMVFSETFVGAAINTGLWNNPTTTMTTTVSNGFATLNAGLSTASAAVAQIRTYRHFPAYKTFTTYVEAEVQFAQSPQANNVCEWGLFLASGTAAPTDGVFFRINASGEFRCVVNFNGTETQSGTLGFATLVGAGNTHKFLIYLGSTAVHFWIDNVLVADIENPAGQACSTASMNLPMAFRNYNSNTTSAAQVMKIGNTNVSLGEQSMSKPWPHVVSGAGGNAAQGQTGGTLGTTALYSNSLAAGAGAAMTNTTAALGSGLGGQFSALPTLAVPTDGIVCSYQVPVGTAAIPGRTLYITGVTVKSMVSTVLAGGPVLYAYSLAFGHTAVSLATTETATTKAPRRIPIGYETFTAAAAVGTLGQGITMNFDSPIVVNSGEFLQLVAKNLGTVTTTGVITFLVTFNGYFE